MAPDREGSGVTLTIRWTEVSFGTKTLHATRTVAFVVPRGGGVAAHEGQRHQHASAGALETGGRGGLVGT
eukprot:740156-Prymnesium_polylepis.1